MHKHINNLFFYFFYGNILIYSSLFLERCKIMIRIAICDDDENDSSVLSTLLCKYSDICNIEFHIEIFENGFLFLDAVKNSFNICFLDIYMPIFSGMDTAKELRKIDKNTNLIFCTSSKEFALDGYSVQACNYLVKPLEENTLFSALDEVIRKINKDNNQKLCIPSIDSLQIISPDTIIYIESDGNYCNIHLHNESIMPCRLSFSQMVERLNKNRKFSLIRRTILLNYDFVVGMEKYDFILSTGEKLSIPRRKKKELTQEFLDYNLEE